MNDKKECMSCKHFTSNITYHFGNGKCELTKKKTEETRTCSKYTHYIKENSK